MLAGIAYHLPAIAARKTAVTRIFDELKERLTAPSRDKGDHQPPSAKLREPSAAGDGAESAA